MAIAFTRDRIRLVAWASGRELATLESPDRLPIGRLDFATNGCQLAASVGDGEIELRDLRAIRQELAEMKLDW